MVSVWSLLSRKRRHNPRSNAAPSTPNRALWGRAAHAIEPLALRRMPLLVAALAFALGEVMAAAWHSTILLLASLAVLLVLLALALQRSLRTALLPLVAFWIGAGIWSMQVRPIPSQQLSLLRYADGLSRTVRGRVTRVRELSRPTSVVADTDNTQWQEPAPEELAGKTISVDLEVEAIEEVTPDISRMTAITGGIRTIITGSTSALRCGDVIEAPLRVKIPERYRDPGAWQYADYLLDQGISTHSTVRAAKVIVLRRESATWQCRLYTAQSWASGRMLRLVDSRANHRMPSLFRLAPGDAGMLNAMLFGDRLGLDKTQRLGFERTGSFHLFVVSGMHVALLAGMLFWLGRRLHAGEIMATLITILGTAGYALLTGFGPPVQRALWMTTLFLLARLLARERSVLNALGAAALGILVWSPAALFQASFQMTFLAILAIGGIAIPLGEQTFLPYARAATKLQDVWLDTAMLPHFAQFRVMLRLWGEALSGAFGTWAYSAPAVLVRSLLWAAELALIGTVAELVMVLPMAMYFHRATMFALPANMLTVPVVVMLAPTALLTFVAGLASPWLALLPGMGTALLLHGITGIIGRISSTQAADLRVPPPVWWIAILALVAWGLCCWAVRRSRASALIAFASLPLVAAAVLWPEPAIVRPGVMEITAHDVGQGDSLLVVSPDGRTMLVDAGGPVGSAWLRGAEASSQGFDVGEEVISPYLWTRRIRRLDIIALTHAHSDHMGGMPAMLRSFRPRELWVGLDSNSPEFRDLIREAASLHITVRHLRAADYINWGGLDIQVLAPSASYDNTGPPVNDDSLVLHLAYGRSSVLLEGDAEAPSERAMLASGLLTPVTLLKVGHHGSKTSSTPEFLAAITPQDAVVSVGRDNTFGHPRTEVIQRFADADTWLFRTDEFGLTTFLLDKQGGIREILGASQ